jgi:hypothetical protein
MEQGHELRALGNAFVVAHQCGHPFGLHVLVPEHPAVAEALDCDARNHPGVRTPALGEPVDEERRLGHGSVGAQVEQSPQGLRLHGLGRTVVRRLRQGQRVAGHVQIAVGVVRQDRPAFSLAEDVVERAHDPGRPLR